MSKRIPAVVAAGLLGLILVLYMVTFQVRCTQYALVKRFGEIRVIDGRAEGGAGLHWKWPWPIERVVKYDRRIRILDDIREEHQTKDNKNIIVRAFVNWRIAEPGEFYKTLGSVKRGDERVGNLVRDKKAAIFGNYEFAQLFSRVAEETSGDGRSLPDTPVPATGPARLAFRDIEREICGAVQGEATKYGIVIDAAGIERIVLPKPNSDKVHETMKEQQNTRAARYRAEGEAQANEIESRATADKDKIEAFAQRIAKAIRAEGEAAAAQYYPEFEAAPELANFLQALDALKEELKKNTTFIVDSKTPLMSLFSSDGSPEQLKASVSAGVAAVPGQGQQPTTAPAGGPSPAPAREGALGDGPESR